MKKSYIIIGVVVIVMLVAIGIYAVINSNSQSKKQLEENSTNIEGYTKWKHSKNLRAHLSDPCLQS